MDECTKGTPMSIILLKATFFFFLLLVFYTYIGYGIVLWLLVKLKSSGNTTLNAQFSMEEWPEVTLLVAAYNEEQWIEAKIKNCLELDYPPEKLHLFFVTDGSDDTTPQRIEAYPTKTHQIALFHQPERKGKIAAVERIMPKVKTPIVVYTDANTLVNPQSIKNIVRHYQNPEVGAVAGEKRIKQKQRDDASSAGEGFYWKYESTLKRWDSELYSVVGAAGELFSIRTELFESVPPDTIIEDFYMTLRIAQKGYRVVYEPDAYAVESSSASVKEELKRKIRIAAGGLQAIYRLSPLLNIFRYGLLSFQYISHRVLRWTITPLALILLLLLNIPLAIFADPIYQVLLLGQLLFYLLALAGYFLEKRRVKFKIFFIPYYFCIMNYAVFMGFFRIISGRQSVLWERAKRAEG